MTAQAPAVPPARSLVLGLAAALAPACLLIGGVLVWLGQSDAPGAREARLDAATAQVGAGIERLGLGGIDPAPHVGELMRTLMSDDAVRCADLVATGSGRRLAAIPGPAGCGAAAHDATQVRRLETDPPVELRVGYVRPWPDGDIRALLVTACVVAGLAASWAAFRILVGRRLESAVAGLEAARSAAEGTSHLLTRASHQIRTAMHDVLGMANVLAETPLDRDQADCVRTIAASSESLLELVGDIIDLARIEAVRHSRPPAPFAPQEVIDDVVSLTAPLAAGRGIETVIAIAPKAPSRVLGDAESLRRVLLHLVGNAFKFTEDGYVVVALAPQDGGLRIEVTDTGIGMPEDTREAILAPAPPEAADADGAPAGSLGLAITRHLVETMGGRMGVVSTVGLGTTFTLDLPLAAAAAPDDDRPEGTGQHILLLDPLLLRRTAHAATLRHAGYRVSAPDGIMPEGAFDLALIDGGMALPDDLTAPRLRFVADLAEARKAGLDGTLMRKPVSATALREAVREALALNRPRPKPRAIVPAAEGRWADGLDVLVVDDNAANRFLLERYFAGSGATLRAAEDGRRAVDHYAERPADFVFLDVAMPVMDGYEAARRIRGIEAERGVPAATLVALTANATSAAREAAVDAGMDAFLEKPLRRAVLLSFVVERIPAKAA